MTLIFITMGWAWFAHGTGPLVVPYRQPEAKISRKN
jgi:hypothetical protein